MGTGKADLRGGGASAAGRSRAEAEEAESAGAREVTGMGASGDAVREAHACARARGQESCLSKRFRFRRAGTAGQRGGDTPGVGRSLRDDPGAEESPLVKFTLWTEVIQRGGQ